MALRIQDMTAVDSSIRPRISTSKLLSGLHFATVNSHFLRRICDISYRNFQAGHRNAAPTLA